MIPLMGTAKLPGPQPWRALKKEHFAQNKSNVMPRQPSEGHWARGMAQAEVLQLRTVTADSGEKKGGAASGRQGDMGQSRF